MNTIKRIPRPIGLTEISSTFNRTKDNDDYNKLYEHTIHHYVRNNFSYCGVYMNIETFSQTLGIDQGLIMKGMNSYGQALKGISDEMSSGDLMRALTFQAFNWVLEDRSRAVQQYSMLALEQQNQYVPFLSGEVGKALKLSQDSAANAMALMKTLGGSGTIMPLDQGTSRQNGDTITVDQAVILMKTQGVTPLLQDPSHQEALFLEHGLENMPNVDARTQTGIDTSKEGLNILDITKLQTLKEDKVTKHLNRRAKEVGKDLEDIG